MRERVERTERLTMTAKRRRDVLARFDGVCARLGCTVSKDLEIDHVIPVWMGGKERIDNLEPLCGPHHAIKTARDAKLRAKVKRILNREDGTRRERRPIPGGTLSHPTLKRTVQGRVVERNPA